MAIAVRVDDKGRLTIPGKVRKRLDVKPGDTFFLEHEGQVLRYAKAENPFDKLAARAVDEFRTRGAATTDDVAGGLNRDIDAQ
jgi:AbrB family looped-hinge helix DNA binding protein